MPKRARITIRILAKPVSPPIRQSNALFRGDWIAMDSDGVHEQFTICVRRQNAGEDGRSACDERTTRPPDMKAIWGRKGRHWRPFA
jgi:hypothetical protein